MDEKTEKNMFDLNHFACQVRHENLLSVVVGVGFLLSVVQHFTEYEN